MYRSRSRMAGRARKLIIGLASVTLTAGAFAISTGLSNAGENCAGLDQALQNNLNFIAGQRANPDSQSAARIANRQAVVDLINQRRVVAGCTGKVVAQPPAAQKPPATQKPPAAQQAAGAGGAGRVGGVVCKGSTVTLSGEAGVPFASSNAFPIGTRLKVTNLDNHKSITVKVQTPSGSCVLLNNAAFARVHEPGKFLIRRAVIQRVG
jgi:hypothetical protein